MKFIVSSAALLKKLQVLSGVINATNTIPVLDHFLFDIDNSNLTITSSDLETTMVSSIKVDSKSKGNIAIPSKLLIDTLKTFPDQPLTFTVEENNIIEIAPLAFMRGRTLNKSFIILDEGQNTTPEQMKMFLTRFGYGSKVIVTGDLTQIDLPKDITSGLIHALDILRELKDVGLVRFSSKDVARHSLVQKIVEAYENFKS